MDTEQDYKVKLEIFEGPLDLLLYLIRKDEIDIYQVSIERITTQYLEYLDSYQQLNIEVASEFIVMAANLIYWKSRTLLPKEVQAPDLLEDEEEEDPRWELIRQLLEYKKFKEAAEYLAERESEGAELYPAFPEKLDLPPLESPVYEEVGVFDLIRSFQNMLRRFEETHRTREIVDDRWTVSDKMEFLLEKIEPCSRVEFSVLMADAESKSELIVTFMALLELMKLHFLQVEQSYILGEIVIYRPDDRAFTQVPLDEVNWDQTDL